MSSGSSSDSESGSESGAGNNRAAESSNDLTPQQVEKLVQLQDLTGIDDLSICRALLESKNWDLEATAREQFDSREAPTPPPPLRPHDEAPEVRQRLFGPAQGGPAAPHQQGAVAAVNNGRGGHGGPMDLIRWGFYWVSLPVFWPVKIFYRVFSGVLWRLAGFIGLAGGGGGGGGRPTRQRLGGPPSNANAEPRTEIAQFIEMFGARYGVELPFHRGSYSQALDEAKKELKFLIVYVHCASHQDTDRFCRQTLASQEMADFLSDKILFGCSLDSKEGYRVSQALRVNAYPVLAVIVLRQNRMMIVGRQEGHCGDAQRLVDRFNAVVADNEAFVVAARADRAERDMNQAIRQEQDAAFQETLRQDQEKERKKREAEEAKREEEARRQAALKSAEERKAKIRQAKIELASKVPREPEQGEPDAVRIVLKLPGGQRLERRFNRQRDDLQTLYFYVFVHPDSPDDFDITTNFPRKVLPCKPPNFAQMIGIDDDDDAGEEGTSSAPLAADIENENVDGPPHQQSLQDAGIGQSTMLFVNDLEA